MDQLVQCPVCTLFLHNGMSLESHLDTHPKDQVIKALCSLSATRSNYGSRASTPMHSERSFRSRSRTPAALEDVSRWNSSHIGMDSERLWHRSSSRTPKTSTVTSIATPDLRTEENSLESTKVHISSGSYSENAFSVKSDKVSLPFSTAGTPQPPSFNSQFSFPPDHKEEKEVKFSRSAEYSSLHTTSSNAFVYNMPAPSETNVKIPNALLSSTPKRNNDLVNMVTNNSKQDFLKLLPKSTNIALLKTNVGSMQYLAPSVMMPTDPSFVQKTPQNNLMMAANIQSSPGMVQTKAITHPLSSNQFNQITSSAFAPNTTVVTQNSQIIYRGMVHNIDGKQFIPGLPAVLSGHENIANVAQASSLYQNVMLLDQYGNTSCMYATPQPLIPKTTAPVFNTSIPTTTVNKDLNDPKTLIIEVGPLEQQGLSSCDVSTSTNVQVTQESGPEELEKPENYSVEKADTCSESSLSSKGLKILSNIKVEMPVQHHKNMLNTVVDLTGPVDRDYRRPESPERILPDIDENRLNSENSNSQNSISSSVSNTFSVIKNVGKPPSYKESKNRLDKALDSENVSPVPDLTCNEKPSISPCSELSDHGENSMPHMCKLETNLDADIEPKKEPVSHPILKTYKHVPLRLNNIYVKKNKKILQIKNAKTFPLASTSNIDDPGPSHSMKIPEHFTLTKIHSDRDDDKDSIKSGKLETISINKITDENDFDADTEEQSMDLELEPVAPSNYSVSNECSTIDLTQVKDEVNTSNDVSNETGISDRQFVELESMRPLNMVQYGSMTEFDDEDSNRELLDLETAKTKQFVNMMNENYFGDNIYADYFTPDRVESFETVRESTSFGKDVWGESSQKESEFVLPNFIHESYKIAESGGSGAGYGGECASADSKTDVLSERGDDTPLDICADERMPPRGELSGQESNGDMEASWNGVYQEVTPAEPYDLMARESWLSDASDADSNDKRDNLEEDLTKPRLYTCGSCGLQYPQLKELNAHRVSAHPPPSCSATIDTKTYRNMNIIGARLIKKEDRSDDVLAGMLQDSKAAIATTMLEVYDAMTEAKPKIEGAVIKTEPKRKRRDYVCPTCKVDQLTDVAFHQHLKIHPLECLTCGKCFFRRANLALHIKTHLGIKNYKCEVCEKRFLTRQKLLEHHNVHTGRAPVKCTHCERAFRRYSNMVQHRDRHHLNKKPKIRDYVCHCGEIFHSRAKLRWHAETHDGKPKACPYCSDKFVHTSSLTRHVRRMHNSYFTRGDIKKNENVPCPICKQVYLRSNLKTHLRTHSGKRPYVCVICNKAFTTQWNLKLHRWTHMSRSSKPFKCSLCKGAFIRQSEYISHMNAHKSVRPYTCNYCGCQFIRKYNCQRHVKEHEVSKKYVCKVPDCGKTFHRSYYLSEHMKVHSGARPFSCSICGKTSSSKSNHNKHVKIHHAREPVATEA